MTRSFFMSLMALLLLVGGLNANESLDISVSDLKDAIQAKTVTVIDVNGTTSFQAAHIPGALDFQVINQDLAKHLPTAKDALIVAYCSGPQCGAHKRATAAAMALGYTNVKHLSAGISGWQAAMSDASAGTKAMTGKAGKADCGTSCDKTSATGASTMKSMSCGAGGCGA